VHLFPLVFVTRRIFFNLQLIFFGPQLAFKYRCHQPAWHASAPSAEPISKQNITWQYTIRSECFVMDAPDDQVDALSKQLEQLLAKKAAITSPLDAEIEKLSQKIDELKPCTALPISSSVSGVVSNDVLVALVAACASDNTNAFARAGRLLFKANVTLSSIRSDRKLSLLHTSARFGSTKIVSQILESDPNLLSLLDDLGRDALLLSVLYRQLHVFHVIARIKDCSFAHQSLPFHNNCLHTIAQFGLVSFARELLNAQRGNDSRVQVAMSQYNSDGLRPIHIMAARLDTEMIKQAASVNPLWLDACTATGANIFDIAVTSQDGLLSPCSCFAFICEIAKTHPPLLEQFLLAASNRYKHTGIIARCDGALLAHVRHPLSFPFPPHAPPPHHPPPSLPFHFPFLFALRFLEREGCFTRCSPGSLSFKKQR
jgi:hypothetical protein